MEHENTIHPEQAEESAAEAEETAQTEAAETESASTSPLCITVDDGVQRVSITNKQGMEIGAFFFRPTDIGIVDRYNEVAARFSEVTAPLENIRLNQDGTVDMDDPAAVQAFGEAKQRLFALCDYLFGGNLSEAFFGSMHPFSPVNGAFYCENVITSVGSFISAQFDRETVKINKRMEKYLPTGNRESRRRR